MASKHDQEQKHKANIPATSSAPVEQSPDVEEYGPIFFHNEKRDFGFMSNLYAHTFRAPHPAKWLFGQSETASSASASGDARSGGDHRQGTMTFRHSEQYYMYCKAIYFGDDKAARKIMDAAPTADCKAAGRSVRGFSDKAWEKHDLKVRVMEEGLWWKFGGGQLEARLAGADGGPAGLGTRQDRLMALGDLGRQLLATGQRQVVEAAGRDRYWGIGYSIRDEPHLWPGLWGRNQLGTSLMLVRASLRELVDGGEEQKQVG